MKLPTIISLILCYSILLSCGQNVESTNLDKKQITPNIVTESAPPKATKKNINTKLNYNSSVIAATGITKEQLSNVQTIIKNVNIEIEKLKKANRWDGINNKETREKYNQIKGQKIRKFLGDELFMKKAKFDKNWSAKN
jgi:hypothetical protein